MYYCLLFFLLGAILASFFGVVGTRWPEGKSIVTPRSHCNYCNHPLSWYELIPILSYFFLKGKCKNCHKRLPFYEPLMEISLGLLFSFFYIKYNFSYNMWIILIVVSLCFLIFLTDLKYMIILDSPLVVSSILIFLLKWFYYGLSYALNGLISGVILFSFMLLVAFLGKKMFKREALGGGDIKLSFVIGLLLGAKHAFLALVLSTFLAFPYATFSLLSTKEREVPFGPFLVSAMLIVFLFYDKFSYVLKLFVF